MNTEHEPVSNAYQARRIAESARREQAALKVSGWLKVITEAAHNGRTRLEILSASLKPGHREALKLLGFELKDFDRRDMCPATGQVREWNEVHICWGDPEGGKP